MHLINDLSLENKISRIDLVPDSAGTNRIKRSLEESYFCDTAINKEIDRSRSRSNPRKSDAISNIQFADKT